MRLLSRLVLSCVLAPFALPVPGSAVTPWDPSRPPDSLRLDNGLRVAVLPWAGVPLVYVRVLYPSGPATEPAGEEGIAHLLEHLMFTSSPGYPHGGLLRALRIHACEWNATTAPDHTEYITSCVPAHLAEILRLEADRMRQPDPTPDEFDREKRVVLEEIALRSHSSATTDLFREVERASFPDHPFGRPVAGTQESVQAITFDDLRAYVHDVHGPAGAVLLVAGDVDADRVRRLVTEAFASVPPGGAGGVRIEPAEAIRGGRTVRLDRWDGTGCSAMLGFRLPRREPTDGPLALFARELLSRSRGGTRLRFLNGEYFLTLRGSFSYRTTDWAGNPAAPDADEAERRAHSTLFGAISDATWERFDAEAFERFRKRTLASYEDALRDPAFVTYWTALSVLQDRDLLAGVAAFDSISATLGPDDVRSYFRTYLDADRSAFGVTHGRDSGRLVELPSPAQVRDTSQGGSTAVDRAPPDLSALRSALEGYRELGVRIRTRKLKGGLPVHLVSVPGASWTTVVAHREFAPLDGEREGKRPGLVRAYDRLMRNTLRKADSTSVSRPSLRVDPEVAELFVRARGRASLAGESMQAVREILDGERLDVSEWSRLQRRLEPTWRNSSRLAWVRAARGRWGLLFGEGHPLLGTFPPDPSAAARLTFTRIEQIQERLGLAEGLRLFVAGDPAVLGPGLDETFGSMKWHEAKRHEAPVVRLAGARGVVVPDFQKKDMELAFSFAPAERADARTGPGWAATALSREIVRARLWDRLREQLGLVYYVYLTTEPAGGPCVVEVRTAGRPADMVRVFDEACREIGMLARSGIGEAELEQARLAIVQRASRWWAEPARLERTLLDMARLGSAPADPIGALLDARADSVGAALRSWLDPDRFAFSVVGPLFEEDLSRFDPDDGG